MSGFGNIGKIPELRKRLLFSLGILAVYRMGIFVTMPGCDRASMREIVASQAGSLLSLFSMFSGGAHAQLSLAAIGIGAYVSASIILQLLSVVFKTLVGLRMGGEVGMRMLNQYTRYSTIILSFVQSFGIAR